MRPRVDAQELRIIAGERAWSFEVDCRANCASVELNGTGYKVRALRWRDKRVLARFSGLGEEFLKREFVRVSLVDPAIAPDG